MVGSSSSRSVWGNNLHGHEEHPINYEQGGSQPASVARHERKLERLRSNISRIGKHATYEPMTSSAAAEELGRLVDIGTPNPNPKLLSSKQYGGKRIRSKRSKRSKKYKKKRTKRKKTKKSSRRR